MALETLDIINGVFSLTFVVISLSVGSIIFSKYFKFKEKIYLLVGATWIFISEPWWPSSLSFLVALNNGIGIRPEIYFLIGNVFVPFAIALWLIAFTEFLYTERRKLILLIFGVYGLIFEVLFFTFLLVNPSLIGELNQPVDVHYNSFILIFLLSFIIIVVISGILFSRLSLKSDDPEVKLKGKLLIIAYIAFTVGAISDAFPLNAITIILTRLILISSAIFWYGGFLLPRWMLKLRKIFLKKK